LSNTRVHLLSTTIDDRHQLWSRIVSILARRHVDLEYLAADRRPHLDDRPRLAGRLELEELQLALGLIERGPRRLEGRSSLGLVVLRAEYVLLRDGVVLVELGRPREVRVGFAQRRLGLTLGGFGLDGGGDRRVRIRAVERQSPLALLD